MHIPATSKAPTTTSVLTTTSAITTEPLLYFYINFTLSDLPFSQDLLDQNSTLANNVTHEVNQSFQNSDLALAFSTCKLVTFSSGETSGTAASLICTFKNNTSMPPFDRVTAYKNLNEEIVNRTFGSYTMNSNSIYVNDLIHLRVNFTLSNLTFCPQLLDPKSPVRDNVTSLVNQAFKNSSLASTFSTCKLVSLSSGSTNGTAVSLDCTFLNNTSVSPIDKVTAYKKLNEETKNCTSLGPYTMNSDSLYVNDLIHLRVNFTLSNLTFCPELLDPKSPVRDNVTSLVIQAFKNSSLASTFSTCKLVSLSSGSTNGTAVSLDCTFLNNTSVSPIDKVTAYKKLNEETKNCTSLGPYTMNSDSLYVNDLIHLRVNFTLSNLTFCPELLDPKSPVRDNVTSLVIQAFKNSSLASTFSTCKLVSLSSGSTNGTAVSLDCTFLNNTSVSPIDKVTAYKKLNEETKNCTSLGPYTMNSDSLYVNDLIHLRVNFTLSNLTFSPELLDPKSPVRDNVTSLVIQAFKNSSLASTFSTCKLVSLSSGSTNGTAVSLDCTFLNNTSVSPIDKVTAYKKLNEETKNCTSLGPYTMNSDSLYVNDLIHLRVNFTLSNLTFSPELLDPKSPVRDNVTSLVIQAFKNSSLASTFSTCKLVSLSSGSTNGTAVSLDCTFLNNTSVSPIDKVTAYKKLNEETKNCTSLGPYTMNSDSLYVNDLIHLRVNFTLSNLTFSPELLDPKSPVRDNVTSLVIQAFKNSSLASTFSTCKLVSLSSGSTNGTAVSLDCTFLNNTSVSPIDKVTAYKKLNEETKNCTSLGPYTMNSDSLYVNDLIHLRVNFTLSNLTFSPELLDPKSPVRDNVTSLVIQAFKNSSLASTFSTCKLVSLSSGSTNGTAVSLDCTFLNNTSVSPIDKVTAYKKLNEETKNCTSLGPYTMNSDSLYVNDLIHLRVNFTLSNLTFSPELLDPKSPVRDNVTSLVIQAFKNSSLASTFSTCKLVSLSSGSTNGTAVSLDCTFLNNTSVSPIDKVTAYKKLNEETKNCTSLGPYTMNSDSLYVNDLIHLRVNFTLSNLTFSPELLDPKSPVRDNVTSLVIQAFKNSSLASTFSTCKLVSLSSGSTNGTAVSLDCTFLNNTSVSPIDKVTAYKKLNEETKNCTSLGPYTMNSDSLYVNDLIHLRVNFTLSNLTFSPELLDPKSPVRDNVTSLVIQAFKNSSLASTFSTCKLVSLSSGSTNGTAVSLDCTFLNNTSVSPIDKVTAYKKLNEETKNCTSLGPYTMNSDSLYVNDLIHLRVNFTLSNLTFSPELLDPKSPVRDNVTSLVIQAFKNSSLASTFSTCKLVSLSSGSTNGTAVSLDCTFLNNTSVSPIDKVTAYKKLNEETKNCTSLGPYTMNSDSLYVNDLIHLRVNFTLSNLTFSPELLDPKSPVRDNVTSLVIQAFKNSSLASTFSTCKLVSLSSGSTNGTAVSLDCTFLNNTSVSPIDKVTAYKKLNEETKNCTSLGPYTMNSDSLYVNDLIHLRVNFTLSNLTFSPELLDPKSPVRDNVTSLVIQAFKNSSLASTFSTCKLVSLSSGSTNGTAVSLDCTFLNNTSVSPIDKVTAYKKLNEETKNCTSLGPYTMNSDSLYVNDLIHLRVNFTLSNLTFSPELLDPKSPVRDNVTSLVIQAFKNSSLASTFSTCKLVSLSSGSTNGTAVSLDCTFLNNTSVSPIDKVTAYKKLNEETKNCTSLGPYTMNSDSLYVNDLIHLRVNFTLSNLTFSPELLDPKSPVRDNVTSLVIQAFKNSSLASTFSTCKLVSLSSGSTNGTAVSLDCTFLNNTSVSPIDKVTAYKKLNEETKNCTSLGPYTMNSDSLYVNDLIHLRVNFTLSNLTFSPELLDPKSPVRDNVTSLVIQAFKNSSLASTFSTCKLVSLSSGSTNGTAVSLDCTFLNNTSVSPIDKVTAYKKLNEETKNCTSLGPYTMNSDSLYVNDLIHLRVNFTLSNLTFSPELLDPKSPVRDNVTSLVIQAFKNSSLASTFSTCKLVSLSSGSTNGTAVSLDCTFLNNTSVSPIDKVTAYKKLNEETKNCTSLGPYTMNSDSLYVNDLIHLRVNFTLSNLTFSPELLDPKSPVRDNVTSLVIQAFKNSSLASTFSTCKLVSLSSGSTNGTAVSLDCTFLNNTSVSPIDKVTAYKKLNEETKNCTSLGPYTMNSDSLYVNDLIHLRVNFTLSNLTFSPELLDPKSPVRDNVTSLVIQAFKNSSLASTFSTCKLVSLSSGSTNGTAVSLDCTFLNNTSVSPIDKVTAYKKLNEETKNCTSLGPYTMNSDSLYVNDLIHLRVNFTLFNLTFSPELLDPKSPVRDNVTSLVIQAFKNSSLASTFSTCKLVSLSSGSTNGTAVSLDCTFLNNTSVSPIDKVTAYKKLNEETKNCTSLGPYTMNSDSLYVNDLIHLRVNFTLSNLTFSPELLDPKSPVRDNVTSLVIQAFKNSSLASTFSTCKLVSLSSGSTNGTAVSLDCTFLNNTSVSPIDKVTAYKKLNEETKNCTSLGPYTMNSDSLYVNDLIHLRVNFTISNLTFCPELLDPKSPVRDNVTSLVIQAFKNSSLASTFSTCKLVSLSSGSTNGTAVSLDCTFLNNTSVSPIDKVTAYKKLNEETKNCTSLGPYTMNSDSLYVNDLIHLRVNFTLSNLTFCPELLDPKSPVRDNVTSLFIQDLTKSDSQKYKYVEATIITLMDNLFKSSEVSNSYQGCRIVRFGSQQDGNDTTVNTLCDFKSESSETAINKVKVYEVFKNATHNLKNLGPYNLDKDSLYVKDYTERDSSLTIPPPPPTTTSPPIAISPSDMVFDLNFTITNRNYSPGMLDDTNSPLYKEIQANVTAMLAALYKNSTVGNNYKYCIVTGLTLGSVKVSSNCIFKPTDEIKTLDSDIIKDTFAKGTNNTDLLGGTYELQWDSLSVKDTTVVIVPPQPKDEFPFWAIIIIVLGILFILFLIFLLCFLLAMVRQRRRKDSYQVMQAPHGLYFPHLR
ncbi:mucin-16-like [Acipenser oxyrinchus oxyrinchus]|uniref:Mucin-16-like n=1 Tax=Acipenser oxyrinchus oxyrinchus TaxID=40147 RepID=A0AAD8FXK5_ACIOX|nr:mucin-16-like [Acipenser oxyrinchus oxyrinchus]